MLWVRSLRMFHSCKPLQEDQEKKVSTDRFFSEGLLLEACGFDLKHTRPGYRIVIFLDVEAVCMSVFVVLELCGTVL